MNWILGIDIAKEKFDVALLDNAQLRRRKVFPNTAEGHVALVAWLDQNGVQDPHVGMEATNIYADDLAVLLHQRGVRVSVLNPASVRAYADSKLSRNKTDKLDAALIADYVRTQQPALWSPPPLEERELQALTRHLDALIQLRLREQNRLETARVASVKASLQRLIETLDAEICALEAGIRQHIDRHPRLREREGLLKSIPGIGDATARLLLAEFHWERFENVRQVVAFAGLNPRKDASGKRTSGKTPLSKLGNARIRKGLYLPAVVGKQWNPVLKALYERLRKRGKAAMEAIGACMRKLLHLAYGVLKSGKPFDPQWATAT